MKVKGPELTPFLVALSFLTVFPGVGKRPISQRQISNSRAFYPLVGLLLGLALVGLERGFRELFPVYLTAALLLVFLVIVTRGLHLDGFMDICDGLFGGYTPERRLEIMKDSHAGAFAVAGAVSLLILKYAALLSLLAIEHKGRESALLLFPVVSRWSMALLIRAFPYVRQQGLGAPFQQGHVKIATAFAAFTALVIAILAGSSVGVAILLGGSLLAWLVGWKMSRMLGGGLVGDCYGATNEIIEVASLIALVALLPHGWVETLPQWLEVF